MFLIRGDLDWLASHHRLASVHSASPCSLCRCTKSDEVPWTDCSAQAAWRQSCWRNSDWALANPRPQAAFDGNRLPGAGIQAFVPDYMHTKHLGTDQYLVASVLMYLCTEVLPGSADENLGVVWKDIKKQYAELETPHSYRVSHLTMGMLGAQPFPRAKTKAAETRCLLLPVARILDQYEQTEDLRQMKLLLLLSAKMDEVVHGCQDFRLPPQGVTQFQLAVAHYNQTLTALCHRMHNSGHMLFAFALKNHYLEHIALVAPDLNPRQAWCYKGEDLMFKVKALAQASSRGIRTQGLANKVVTKYLSGLDMLLAA